MSRLVILIFSCLLSYLLSRNARPPLVKGPSLAQLEDLRSDQPLLEDKHSYDPQEYDYDYHLDTDHQYYHQVEPQPSLPSWVLPLIAFLCTAPFFLPISSTTPWLCCGLGCLCADRKVRH